MAEFENVLCGAYSDGSPVISFFSAEWGSASSAVRSAAAKVYDAVIITDYKITERAVNASLAKALGLGILQGWVVKSTAPDGVGALLTIFPTSADMERVFCTWSITYPREAFSPMECLPFGGSPTEPLFTNIPMQEILKYRKQGQIYIFNSPLQDDTAIPYNPTIQYDGYFVRPHKDYIQLVDKLMYLKRVSGDCMFLPHLGVGGDSNEENVSLHKIMQKNLMFPLPSAAADRCNDTVMAEFAKIEGLLDSPSKLFERLPEIDVIAALVPGAQISAEYGVIEKLPYELRLSDDKVEKLFEELKSICLEKINELYADENDMSDYAVEILKDEFRFLREYKAHNLVSTFILLYNIFYEETGHCIILKECCVKLIPFLLGLSRFNPVEEELGNHDFHPEILKFVDSIDLEVSFETFELLAKSLGKLKPGQAALLGGNDVAGKCSNILLAPDGVVVPGVNVEGSPLPAVSGTFASMAEGIVLFSIHINKNKTLSRFEAVHKEILQCFIPGIPKRVEKEVFDKYFIKLDVSLTAGIGVLTPLLCERFREAKVSSRYEAAITMAKYYLDNDFIDFYYYLQWVDIILLMLVALLAYPDMYYKCIYPNETMLDSYTEDVIEIMFYDPTLKEEHAERVLIDKCIDEWEYRMAAADSEMVAIYYAKNKRRYPEIFL